MNQKIINLVDLITESLSEIAQYIENAEELGYDVNGRITIRVSNNRYTASVEMEEKDAKV
jgi:zona occludens toxin (predicted ATPase)